MHLNVPTTSLLLRYYSLRMILLSFFANSVCLKLAPPRGTWLRTYHWLTDEKEKREKSPAPSGNWTRDLSIRCATTWAPTTAQNCIGTFLLLTINDNVSEYCLHKQRSSFHFIWTVAVWCTAQKKFIKGAISWSVNEIWTKKFLGCFEHKQRLA